MKYPFPVYRVISYYERKANSKPMIEIWRTVYFFHFHCVWLY